MDSRRHRGLPFSWDGWQWEGVVSGACSSVAASQLQKREQLLGGLVLQLALGIIPESSIRRWFFSPPTNSIKHFA